MLDISRTGKDVSNWLFSQDLHQREAKTVARANSLEAAGCLATRLQVVRTFLEDLRKRRNQPAATVE